MKTFMLKLGTIAGWLACTTAIAQNVGINSTGAAPNASAMLDVDAAPANDKGLLIPRVALTQTGSNAPIGAGVATSLMVYNTATANDVTPGYYYWDGTKWVRLLGNNNAWLLTGNAGTVAGTNFLGTTDTSALVFKTNNTEWMRILTNGYVGIGTPTPSEQLELLGGGIQMNGVYGIGFRSEQPFNAPNVNDAAKIYYDASASLLGSFAEALVIEKTDINQNDPDGAIIFVNKGMDSVRNVSMVIRGSGRVGVNTRVPASMFEVVEASAAATRGILSTQYTNSTLGARMILRKARGADTLPLAVLNGDNTGLLVFAAHNGAAFTESATVESKATQNWATGATGSNLIFTTTANNTSVRLERMIIDDIGRVGIGTSIPTQALHVVGNICYTGTSGACSDKRYKKNFNPIANALDKVLQLKGLTYYWKTEEFPDQKFTADKQIGFIAQELEKIFPELVLTDANGFKSVDYARLTPILVEAIKAQQQLIESQNLSIVNLKAENTKFQSAYEKRLAALESIIGSANAKK